MPKQVQPGDLLVAVRELRRLLASLDSAAFALSQDFSPLGGDIEELMKRLRAPNDLLTTRLVESLEAIEASKSYQQVTRTDK